MESERIPIANAKMIAVGVEISPTINGRFRVRPISTSRSCSKTWLKALADPAAKVPPIKVAKVRVTSGIPPWASTIAGNVETNKSSTTLNFINAIRARDFVATDTG
jgi:hypothetical protein